MVFFTVEVLTLTGLVRHVAFFAIDLKTRAVEVLGTSAAPDGEWMPHLACNATDGVNGFLRTTSHRNCPRGAEFDLLPVAASQEVVLASAPPGTCGDTRWLYPNEAARRLFWLRARR